MRSGYGGRAALEVGSPQPAWMIEAGPLLACVVAMSCMMVSQTSVEKNLQQSLHWRGEEPPVNTDCEDFPGQERVARRGRSEERAGFGGCQ